MIDFQEGDIVRIHREPDVQCLIRKEGKVGFIDELEEYNGTRYARFQELRLDGLSGGSGSIPLDCLTSLGINEAPHWYAARDKVHAHRAHLDREYELYRQELEREKALLEKVENRAVGMTSSVIGLSPMDLHKLLDVHEKSRKAARTEFKDELAETELRLRYHRKDY